MRRLTVTILSGSMLTLALAGCPGQNPAFKQAVARYSPHQVEYARGIGDCKKTGDTYSDDCIVNWAFPMSGLQCLVDEDGGKSKPGALSKACACSSANTPANRTKACTDWLNTGN